MIGARIAGKPVKYLANVRILSRTAGGKIHHPLRVLFNEEGLPSHHSLSDRSLGEGNLYPLRSFQLIFSAVVTMLARSWREGHGMQRELRFIAQRDARSLPCIARRQIPYQMLRKRPS
jgi:hypothetical protein